jgi:hypothetical protein
MFRFAGRNETAAKPLKTNDRAKFLVAFSFRRAKRTFRICGLWVSRGGPKRNGRFVFAAARNEIFAEETEVAKRCAKAHSSPWNR